MKLQEYMDDGKLMKLVADGYINQRKHPTLPLFIYNYGPAAQFEQHWPHEVCACRGLIVDGESNIVSRPMYKFFNLGQPSTILGRWRANQNEEQHDWSSVPVTPVENVMVDSNFLLDYVKVFNKSLTITRKMDGQMGVLWNYGDQWGIATRGSFESDGAKFATEKFQKFVKFGATEFIPKGWTLIFEIIAKHLRIVIPYEWEGLCLLTAVNNETGEEMPYEQLHELWTNLNSYSKTNDAEGNPTLPGKPWCRIVEKFDIDLNAAENDPSMEEEGYVVAVNRPKLPPVVKAKIKLAEYKRLHRILCNVTPQMIWAELANPMEPWLAVQSKFNRQTGETTHSLNVPPDFANWVRGWQRGLTNAFHEKLALAMFAAAYMEANKVMFTERCTNDKERKEILNPTYGREIADIALQLYRGRIMEAYEAIWKLVRPFGKEEHFYVEGKGE